MAGTVAGMATAKLKPISLRVGRRIAELRHKSGKTQEELAEEIGVGWRYVSMVERGVQNVGVNTLEKFAIGLGVDIRDLFEEPASGAKAVKKGRPKSSA